MSSTVKVKIKTNDNSTVSRSNLLQICMNGSVRVSRVVAISEGFLLHCASADYADTLFSDEVHDALVSCHFEPVMPPELKAKRCIILRRLDNIIYENDPTDIAKEIENNNHWSRVKDVFKFPNSRAIKVTFSSAEMAVKSTSSGLCLYHLYIPSCDIVVDQYISVVTCYRCFKIDDHLTFSCPMDTTYKICSNCASPGHDWKTCESSIKKCINCGKDHHSLSMSCPVRKEVLRGKRNSGSGRKFAQVVSSANETRNDVPHLPDTDVMAKSYACIVLALIKNDERPGSFDKSLNDLFQANKLPTLHLNSYEPPSSTVLSRSGGTVGDIAATGDPSVGAPRGELVTEARTPPHTGSPVAVSASRASDAVAASTPRAVNGAPSSSGRTSGISTVSTPEVSNSVAVSTPSRLEDMRDVKILKRKGTTICDGADLQRAFDEGNAVVLRKDGRITNSSDISAITNTMFDIPSIILELSNAEFSKHIKSCARSLRKNTSRIPNK